MVHCYDLSEMLWPLASTRVDVSPGTTHQIFSYKMPVRLNQHLPAFDWPQQTCLPVPRSPTAKLFLASNINNFCTFSDLGNKIHPVLLPRAEQTISYSKREDINITLFSLHWRSWLRPTFQHKYISVSGTSCSKVTIYKICSPDIIKP